MGIEREVSPSGRRFFLLLLLYLACHLLFRVVITGNAELDEAEQLVWGQSFALGYGAELPLYTWLQATFFSLFGTNIFAVALLRSTLLFLVYLFTYFNALEITGNRSCAVAAAASLLLIPLISWEAQRILITMLLATALTSISLFLFLRVMRTGLSRYYILLGLAAGFGMLTKYNFGIFAVSLLLSAVSVRALRSRLINMRMLATAAFFLMVTVAPFAWILSHPAAAMAKAGRLHPVADVGLLHGYLAGFGDLLKGIAGFHLFLVPVIFLIFLKAPIIADEYPRDDDLSKLLKRAVLIALSVCVILILFCHVTHLKARWLLPLLYPVPIYLVSKMQSRLGTQQLRRLLACSAVAAFIILVAMPGRIVFARQFGTFSRMNTPYDQLAMGLKRGGFTKGIIIAESNLLGGNLKLRFPENRVVVPGIEKLQLPGNVPVLLAWDATEKYGVPERLAPLAASLPSSDVSVPRYMEVPALHMPERRVRLGFILLLPDRASEFHQENGNGQLIRHKRQVAGGV
jgi:4-amino-4-deoxy-L-arabinose transferase-like glycosyltransferase